MLVAQRHTGLLGDFVHAVFSIGRALAAALPDEPAPYWTDYLRETDRRNR
jgi:hypothetical protein